MTSTETSTQESLFPPPPRADIVVNGRCIIYCNGGDRVVWVCGQPVYRYHRDDEAGEKLFIAQALESGFAKPGELAKVLSPSLRTVHRARQRYVAHGVAGLVARKRGPKGARLGNQREAAVRRWHAEGISGREMARRLGVSPSTVGQALDRMGLPRGRRAAPQQLALLSPQEEEGCVSGREDEEEQESPVEEEAETPARAEAVVVVEPEPEGEAKIDPVGRTDVGANGDMECGVLANGKPEVTTELKSEGGTGLLVLERRVPVQPVETTLDTDPMNRVIDRMLAAQGELLDAAPLFAPGESIPRAGVLLAVPHIVASGVFEAAREVYGHIGPAFYGLRTTLLTLLLLALLRIKHPENVKEYSAPELGRVIGLDRAPEVKTIRRKLGRLAQDDRAEEFVDKLVKHRVRSRSEALGFLYVDGHVRVYSGKADLPKTHVARMRISLPATQDVWVNDAEGSPLFFVTQDAHPQLVGALPRVLGEVRELVGPEQRVTVVFDRGGWSPKLFKQMDQAGFDVLTYRKGKSEPVPEDEFVEHVVPGTGGKQVYELHDTEVSLLRGKFSMRQVTRKKGDHQTKIMTTRKDLDVVEVAVRMFDRWRQENFFKYMRDEYAIDALVEYGLEPDDPARLVPNPARKDLDRKVRKAKEEVARLEADYGCAALDNQEKKRPTMRGFKIANGTQIGIPLRKARAHLAELLEQRSQVPTKVPVGEIKDEVVRLPRRKKRLSDGLKMLAYQIETDVVRVLAPFYKRVEDEGRRLATAALKSSADLEVTEGELRVTLAPQSSPHRSRAIAELCRLLNATHTYFPGTQLRLRYAVRGVGSAT